MDFKKTLGILFAILGLIFIVFPIISSQAVSVVAGVCLIAFGIATLVDGISFWRVMASVSAIKVLIGILAIIFGFLFFYDIDVLSFLVGYLFYLLAFVLVFSGLMGLFSQRVVSKAASIIIFILGLIAIYLAFFSITHPIYAAVLVGICLVMEGLMIYFE